MSVSWMIHQCGNKIQSLLKLYPSYNQWQLLEEKYENPKNVRNENVTYVDLKTDSNFATIKYIDTIIC